MLVTTGAEAVENSIKIARAATRRSAVISFSGAFHGRTLMALALTGKTVPYKKGFGPLSAEVFHAPYPDEYMGITAQKALAGLANLFATDVDPGQVAAVIIEPVQGEGGFVPAPRGFLKELRRLCDEHGILLIADEIQTGLARTGQMFACEHDGVRADLVTIAKGLGGGMPIAAIVGRADIMDAAPAGALGGTYAGNPLSVAAAHAVLDVIEEENLCARATHIGSIITRRLQDIASRPGFEAIGNVRGPGAMIGIELVKDRATRMPHPTLCSRVVAEAQQRGALLLSCGSRNNVIRLLPALTMSDAILEEGLDIVEAAIKASGAGLEREAA